MPYNRIIEYKLTDVDAPVVEPVTVAEAKAFALVVSSAQDSVIERLITTARQLVENATGLALIPKTVEVWLAAPNGMMELPFGPVLADPAPVFEDDNGTTIEPTLIGFDFPKIKGEYDLIKAEYSVGFETVPTALKQAILFHVVDYFENRGDDPETGVSIGTQALCKRSAAICLMYSRIPVIL